MPPQRRKYNVEPVDENKRNSKRIKNTMHLSRRSSNKANNSENYLDSASFSQKKCTALFHEYTGPDDPETIGPVGMEKLCRDLNVQPEDIAMLVLAWKMDAKQMGYFTLGEWMKGLSDLQCDSLSKLRSKMDYLRSILNDTSTFKSVYRYSFDFAKDRDQRNMDIETAKALLHLLLAEQWSLFIYFQQFLEQSKYKVLNKDQWYNIIEFSKSISSPDLRNYDEDGAWPVLLDEFVEWYHKCVMKSIK